MLSSWIYEFADLFLKTENSAALVSSEGDIIHAKSDLNFEVTGFKNIADTSLKYISLKPGEILVTNDSYGGGSFLHRYTFLMPLTLAENNQPGLLLCVRREFSPGLNIGEKVDDEGLRIPPTPIFQNAQLITSIIEAMSMHPLCPRGFNVWLQKTVADLGQLYTKWNQTEKTCKFQITAAELKKFLAFSKKFATERILEKAQGEARSEVRLDSGETLKLHLEINNGLVKADFSGTTAGIKNHLPDLSTFGACYAALAHFYKLSCIKNSGSFSILQVTKPLGCFLNAKYPASTHQGYETGVAAVQLAVTLALHQIVKSSQAVWAKTDLRMEISFSESLRWFSHWSANACSENLSIEKIESQYPVQFVKLEKNIEKKIEKTHFVLEFTVLAACQIRWLSDFTQNPIKAPPGLKVPEPTQIETLNDKGEWTRLPSQGSTDLPPGTSLRLNLWGLLASSTNC